MVISKQDKQLAIAAVALYRAAEFGCVPDNRDSDEACADDCIQVATNYMLNFPYCGPDNVHAITDYVYGELRLDRSKAHCGRRVVVGKVI